MKKPGCAVLAAYGTLVVRAEGAPHGRYVAGRKYGDQHEAHLYRGGGPAARHVRIRLGAVERAGRQGSRGRRNRQADRRRGGRGEATRPPWPSPRRRCCSRPRSRPGATSPSRIRPTSISPSSPTRSTAGTTGVGGPEEEVVTTAAADLTPRTGDAQLSACSPGPGDDNCIQLYEPGVRTALAELEPADRRPDGIGRGLRLGRATDETATARRGGRPL